MERDDEDAVRNASIDTLAVQAAALMLSLAMNHPFIDGHKRVAFALTAHMRRT
jgi:prophage maintenance system killer protein